MVEYDAKLAKACCRRCDGFYVLTFVVNCVVALKQSLSKKMCLHVRLRRVVLRFKCSFHGPCPEFLASQGWSAAISDRLPPSSTISLLFSFPYPTLDHNMNDLFGVT